MTRVRGLSDGFRREECLATNCIDGYQGDQWIDHEEWDGRILRILRILQELLA